MQSKRVTNWRRYLRFWGPNVDADVDDELQFHLAMRERELRERGLDGAAARAQARERFGDVSYVRTTLRDHDRRRLRQARRIEVMDELLQDIRYGARKLGAQRTFTLAVVTVLALGIGATTAIFSAVDAAMLRPLPFLRPAELVKVRGFDVPFERSAEEMRRRPKGSPDLDDLRALQGPVFSNIAVYASGGLNLTSDGEAAERVRVTLVTPSFWPTLGVQPFIGRAFLSGEGTPNGPRVAILSYGLWQQRFGADPAIVGKHLGLNGATYEIVGVMARGFAFPSDAQLWTPFPIPFAFSPEAFEPFRSYLPHQTVARLASGVAVQQAASRAFTLWKPYESAITSSGITQAGIVAPLQASLVGTGRTALLVLLGATTLVLLTACANVSNLLLTRAAGRQREMALRTALGASRNRVVRQLLTESVMLAVLGALAGVALAYVGLDALRAVMPESLVQVSPPRLDGRVLGVALAIAAFTGLLFGLWPALGATRVDVADAMKAGSRVGGTSAEGSRMRRGLAVTELALAVMLVVGATLMLRSFATLVNTDSGIRAEHVASTEVTLSHARFASSARRRAFYDAVIARVRAVPGVEAAAAVNELPLRGEYGIGLSYQIPGKPPIKDDDRFALYLRVTPDYFSTLGITLRAGRVFQTYADTSKHEAVINEQFAAKAFPGEDALGRDIVLGGDMRFTVVGIVRDVRSAQLDEPAREQAYLPFAEDPSPFAGMVARGTLEPPALMAALRDAVRAVEPTQPIYNLRMMEDVIASAIAPRRTNTVLIATFGALALLLAAVGVYGVIAYGVTQRTREIGIRVALGAQRGSVVRLVAREGVWLVVIGLALGLAGAWMLSRVLESMLYGVSIHDTWAFVLGPAVLVIAALLATMLPARQASRISPMEAIRSE